MTLLFSPFLLPHPLIKNKKLQNRILLLGLGYTVTYRKCSLFGNSCQSYPRHFLAGENSPLADSSGILHACIIPWILAHLQLLTWHLKVNLVGYNILDLHILFFSFMKISPHRCLSFVCCVRKADVGLTLLPLYVIWPSHLEEPCISPLSLKPTKMHPKLTFPHHPMIVPGSVFKAC